MRAVDFTESWEAKGAVPTGTASGKLNGVFYCIYSLIQSPFSHIPPMVSHGLP